jgi:hypothetical protein
MFKKIGLPFLAVFPLLGTPTFLNSPCVSGNLSGIIGTTCDIGNLQFTFNGLSGQDFSNVGGVVTIHNWDASDFTLTPTSDGFGISFDAGPQNISAPSGGDIADDYAELDFDLNVFGGELIGDDVSGGILSASGAFATGFYQNDVCSILGCGTSEMQAFDSTVAGHVIRSGPPFSSGTAVNDIFNLQVSDGNAVASWDGTQTNFTFTVKSTAPEPSNFLIGLLCCLGIAQIRRHQKRRTPPSEERW